jgi:hypothetical protein
VNTVGWPVIDGVLILIVWAVICAATPFLGRWLVRLRTSLLSKGADTERIRRELDSILCDYSSLEKLRFGAGLFINVKRLQDEADERESERTHAHQPVLLGDRDQPLYWRHDNVDLAYFSEDKSLCLIEFKMVPHHGAESSLSGYLDRLPRKSIEYLIITHPDADHGKPNLPD